MSELESGTLVKSRRRPTNVATRSVHAWCRSHFQSTRYHGVLWKGMASQLEQHRAILTANTWYRNSCVSFVQTWGEQTSMFLNGFQIVLGSMLYFVCNRDRNLPCGWSIGYAGAQASDMHVCSLLAGCEMMIDVTMNWYELLRLWRETLIKGTPILHPNNKPRVFRRIQNMRLEHSKTRGVVMILTYVGIAQEHVS